MSRSLKARLADFLQILVFAGIIIVLFLIVRLSIEGNAHSADTDKKIITSQNSIEAQLSCLGAFFTKKDRQNLAIKDLNICEIVHTDTGKTEIIPTTPSITPAALSDDTKQTSNSSTKNTNGTTKSEAPRSTTSQNTPPPALPQEQANGFIDVNLNPKPGDPYISIIGVKCVLNGILCV